MQRDRDPLSDQGIEEHVRATDRFAERQRGLIGLIADRTKRR